VSGINVIKKITTDCLDEKRKPKDATRYRHQQPTALLVLHHRCTMLYTHIVARKTPNGLVVHSARLTGTNCNLLKKFPPFYLLKNFFNFNVCPGRFAWKNRRSSATKETSILILWRQCSVCPSFLSIAIRFLGIDSLAHLQ
jgi:hypothetical protein